MEFEIKRSKFFVLNAKQNSLAKNMNAYARQRGSNRSQNSRSKLAAALHKGKADAIRFNTCGATLCHINITIMQQTTERVGYANALASSTDISTVRTRQCRDSPKLRLLKVYRYLFQYSSRNESRDRGHFYKAI